MTSPARSDLDQLLAAWASAQRLPDAAALAKLQYLQRLRPPHRHWHGSWKHSL